MPALEEVQIMTEFGCSELQGYYFSRPIDKEQLSRLLETFVPKVIPSRGEHRKGEQHHSAAA